MGMPFRRHLSRSKDEKIQAIVDRMRCFFIGTKLTAANRKTVEKWAKEIEECLKEE